MMPSWRRTEAIGLVLCKTAARGKGYSFYSKLLSSLSVIVHEKSEHPEQSSAFACIF